ncbi:glycerol-3-phosphate acyltransferase [Deinococcus taeanensis]|uniref:glycerol-3-phosphate acyltransferase n=1 Tax=Deinococcus taeanensis TaxID=2737050 RepID=UPI001CDC8D62|nr:glycerol-3-phosphate acyltransferase [Deinococcus taeanensis]UBV42465.1 glycerol-3-phosphate acyltransferase [Deinococcus taeanensis]
MPALTVTVVAYLLGSLVCGVLYSRWRGADIRDHDLPGGSGTYRQYGRGAAILVTAGDILKGLLAGLLCRWAAPDAGWLVTGAVVAGHCYPVFFGFRGGGGIAPLLGALLALAPLTLLGLLATALTVIPVYRATLQRRVNLNAVPFAALIAVPVGLLLATRFGGWGALLAGGAVMALRSAHLLLRPGVGRA